MEPTVWVWDSGSGYGVSGFNRGASLRVPMIRIIVIMAFVSHSWVPLSKATGIWVQDLGCKGFRVSGVWDFKGLGFQGSAV